MKVEKNIFDKKVLVAMSGGVDSSVAAALLKNEGYNVGGVFLKFWHDVCFSSNENKCCSSDSLKRAKEVARILNIPFYVYDFRKEFKKKIVEYFIEEYEQGRTPNPCVLCNKEIKFGLLFDKINSLDVDYLATGHYIKKQESRIKNQELSYKVFRAKDKKKDQSYFLYNLNQEKLSKLLFPLSDYNKEEVRKLAKKYKLPTVKTAESQDVCFLPKEGLEVFLKKYIKNIQPGLIVDINGNKLGEHNGLPFYTMGQRKGIKIGGGDPYYVIGKNIEKNELIVSHKIGDSENRVKKFLISSVNWINKNNIEFPIKANCQVRYKQKSFEVKIFKDTTEGKHLVESLGSKILIVPGQSAVFYKKEELLGGGVIN